MTMLAPDARPRWKSFLEETMADEVQRIVSGQADKMELSFHQIQTFDPDFADMLLDHPTHILREGSAALKIYCIEMGAQDIEPFIRIDLLPLDSRRDLRRIGHVDVQKLISSEVSVTKVSEIKPRIHRSVFQCSCDYETEIIQHDHTELEEPLQCEGCGERKGRVKFTLMKEKCSLVDNQKIEIQEIPERVPSGAQPSTGMVILEGDLVNSVLPGTRIIANMIPQMNSERKGSRKTPLFEIFYSMVSVEAETTPFTEIIIDDEEEEKIKKLVKEYGDSNNLINLLVDSIAPSIFPTPVLRWVKRSLALQLFGGVARVSSDGTRSRGDIHILLMGDPGVAKSQLLTYMSNLSPRGKFTSGGSVSAAGLTAAAVKDGFSDGRFALEAGVLPLSDRGLAAIDEFDKISKQDTSAIHPAMEQQKIRVAKGGITATLNSRCAVLAAANPESGRFDPLSANASIMQSFKETGLETPLASRFDLIWLLQDTPEPGLDEKIARHILQNRTSGVSELQIEDKMGSEPIPDSEEIMDIGHDQKQHLTTNFLRKYVAYAKRNIHPSLDDEAKNLLVKYYIKTRNSFNRNQNNPRGSDYGISQSDKSEITEVPVTARALEALMRLTEAHARIHLRQTATVVDAEVAKAIFMHWRDEANIRDEAEFQTGMSKQKQSSLVRIIMQEISDANEGRMKMSQIIDAALIKGISDSTVRSVISRLSTTGAIYEPQTGTYEWA